MKTKDLIADIFDPNSVTKPGNVHGRKIKYDPAIAGPGECHVQNFTTSTKGMTVDAYKTIDTFFWHPI